MTKPVSATANGLQPHYKIRIAIPGALIHTASHTEPTWANGELTADWINDHRYGDTLGHIDWSTVAAVTWRWTE